MPEQLLCPRCGAPLRPPGSGERFLTCGYCGIAMDVAKQAGPAPASGTPASGGTEGEGPPAATPAGPVLAEAVGLEAGGGLFLAIFDEGTALPAERREELSTAKDNQPSIELHVLAGHSDDAGENRSLGRYRIAGLPEAPRGVPKVTAILRLGHTGRAEQPADVARFELLAEDENGPLTVERVDDPSSGAEPLATARP